MEPEDPLDDELQELRKKRLREMEQALFRSEGAAVIDVTDATIGGMVRAHPYVLVDFWAEWCGPCRTVGPVVEELALEFEGRVTIAKCNVDENPRVAAQLSISAIPTLILFAHGQMVDRITGAYPKAQIRQRMQRAFGH
ncbi:MAG TPA: thioredoxin [Methanoculleus sp.]|nr:thioredoxin [Methanoculleus sp.]